MLLFYKHPVIRVCLTGININYQNYLITNLVFYSESFNKQHSDTGEIGYPTYFRHCSEKSYLLKKTCMTQAAASFPTLTPRSTAPPVS